MKKCGKRLFSYFMVFTMMLGLISGASGMAVNGDENQSSESEEMIWEGPVIEEFEIVNVSDGGILYSDGSLQVDVTMYAQDGAEINFELIKFNYNVPDEGWGSDWRCTSYEDKGDNEYTLYFKNVHQAPLLNMELSEFCVGDNWGNESKLNVADWYDGEIYNIDIIHHINENITIERITLDPENVELTDTISQQIVNLELVPAGDFDVNGKFVLRYEVGYDDKTFRLSYDSNSESFKGSVDFDYYTTVYEDPYVLETILYGTSDDENEYEEILFDESSENIDVDLMFEKNNTDKEAPEFLNFYMTINGEKVTEPGVRVAWTDEVAFYAQISADTMDLNGNYDREGDKDGYVYAELHTWIEGIENTSVPVFFQQYEVEGEENWWKGTLNFESDDEGKSMYPTGWGLSHYESIDAYNNRYVEYGDTEIFNKSNCYFYLMKGDAYKLDANTIVNVAAQIEAAEEGSEVEVDMRNPDGDIATVVPEEILSAAKDKDVDVVLNMDKYSWTINGEDITEVGKNGIDLEIIRGMDYVDEDVIKDVTNRDGEDIEQLYLAHNGEFGFDAKLTIDVGAEKNKGKKVKLYHYNEETGKLEDAGYGEVDSDGKVELQFSHASDYIIEIVSPEISHASLVLYDNLAMRFKTGSDEFADGTYSNPYVKVDFDGNQYEISDYTIETVDDNERYVFEFADISPDKMKDTIRYTFHATLSDGTEYSSEAKEYSVAQYCYAVLEACEDDTYAKLRTLLVDLLNYGTASQAYTEHNTENPANGDLTDQQRQWATTDTPVFTSCKNGQYETVDNAVVSWKTVGLALQDSVVIRYKINIGDEDVSTLSMIIKNAQNSEIGSISGENFESIDGAEGCYYVYFKGLNAGQMSEAVYATIYKNDNAVSNTLSYSIESYAYDVLQEESFYDEKIVTLVTQMMKYGNAANAYIS